MYSCFEYVCRLAITAITLHLTNQELTVLPTEKATAYIDILVWLEIQFLPDKIIVGRKDTHKQVFGRPRRRVRHDQCLTIGDPGL